MKTYEPLRAMIVCENDTGSYVSKADYDALHKAAKRIYTAGFWSRAYGNKATDTKYFDALKKALNL